MSNDQSYLDGIPRDVIIIPFDRKGTQGEGRCIGAAITYEAACLLVHACGFRIAPEGEGFDCGHVANPDGPDAYGIPVLV
jgi:hypothetical protein